MPVGEQYQVKTLLDQWEALVGYSIAVNDTTIIELANAGVLTMADIGQYASKTWGAIPGMQNIITNMPWAVYGLGKDEYQSLSTTYGTEYKKVTGQDISATSLAAAFGQHNPTGALALMSGSQYAQQLMNDATIQKQYGWVKYGMDYTAWTQQKLQVRGAFGRDIQDAEAATLLQYNKSATGASMSAVGHQAGQQAQQAPGAGQSVVR